MAKSRNIIIILLLAFCLPVSSYAQYNRHKVGLDVSVGNVFPSHKFLRGQNLADERIDRTASAHVKYGFHFDPDTEFGRLFPDTYQGLGITYATFFNREELGNPLAIYVFQHSRIFSFCRRLSFDYEWNFGIAANWAPYDRIHNPYNFVIGSDVTAYINLGFMLNWKLAGHWNLMMGVDGLHCSNGNTTYPNYGLNTMSLRAGVTGSFGEEFPEPARVRNAFKRHVTYDLILHGAWRKRVDKFGNDSYVHQGYFAVAGLNFNPLYNIAEFFRAGLSLDLMYDESANLLIHETGLNSYGVEFEKPPLVCQFMGGISARAELVMPIFSVNFGIGDNLLSTGDEFGLLYYVLALKTSFTKNIFAHVGVQFYTFEKPRCLMLGLGYRFNVKGKS